MVIAKHSVNPYPTLIRIWGSLLKMPLTISSVAGEPPKRAVLKEEKSVGGQLGRPSGARFRTYERLKQYAEDIKGTLFDRPELHRAIEEIYRFPLREAAKDGLNRLLRSHASNETIAQKVLALRDSDALTVKSEEIVSREPRIICSMGLSSSPGRD